MVAASYKLPHRNQTLKSLAAFLHQKPQICAIRCLANSPEKSCDTTTFKIKTPNKILFNDRFIKVALHELGHKMGLPHCTFTSTSFMEAAEGIIKSVDKETRYLCSNCKKLISQYKNE